MKQREEIAPKRWSPRRRLVGRILRLLFGRRRWQKRLAPDEIDRVLLIRYDRLGDAVVTTPVIEALHRLSSSIEIDVLGSRHNASLLEADHRISQVHVWDGSIRTLPGIIHACRRRDYDLTLQLILNRTTNPALIAGLATPHGRVVGKGHSYNATLFDHLVASRPRSDHFADQTYSVLLDAIEPGHLPAEAPPYRIDLPEDVMRATEEIIRSAGLQPGGYLLLNASAGAADRSFGVEKGVELARGLRRVCDESDTLLAISGSPEEREKVEAIAEASGATILRFPSITHLCCGVARSLLLVTPDTGPVHIASATGTPVIAYYSEHDKPEGWGPRGEQDSIVVARDHGVVGSVEVAEIVEKAGEAIQNSKCKIQKRGR